MPIIYEYFGLVFKFYSKEHEPIHVHIIYQGQILRAEFFIRNGKVFHIDLIQETRRFPPAKIKDADKLVRKYREEIVKKWDDYFVWKKKVKKEIITKKLK